LKIDMNFYDGIILIAGDRKRGVWSQQTLARGTKTTRAAGQLPTSASIHTLQVVAVANALRSITRSDISRLTGGAPRKARLVVASDHASFIEAIQSAIKGDKDTLATNPLRAGKNFLGQLAQQIARFEITWQTPELGDHTLKMLKDWSTRAVVDPKSVAAIPAILMPTAVSAVLSQQQ
jgi:hypothetical protein